METPTPKAPSEKPRKAWHAPQCTRKHWQTPRFVAIEFGETLSGIVAMKTENSTGTLPTGS